MAIIWADFPSGQHGLYGSTIAHMFNGIWAGYSGTNASNYFSIGNDPDPNIGSAGRVLQGAISSGVADVDIRFALPAGATAEVGVGCRLWMSQLPELNTDAGNPRILFKTTGNALIAFIEVGATGQVIARNSANTILGESGPVLTANANHHIEVRCLRHASAGEIEVRVNGVVKLDLDTLALGASDIGTVAFGLAENDASITPTNYWKDLVFWDTSGTSGNTFQGSVAVHDLYPDGDISLNWTASTGSTGYNLIDETTPNDADYIQAGDPAPSPAVFSLTDLPEDVTSVRALLPIARAVKTDGGDCNLQVSVTPNNTDWDDGADRPITTAFTYWWDVSPTSPATSAAWTPSEVNAAYVKANRTL
jgi:hypothetical protein